MRLREQLAEDKKKLQQMNRQEKAQFIWDYYKIPIIAVTVVLFLGILSYVTSLGQKDTAMYVVLLNNDAKIMECDSEIFDRYLAAEGIDLKNKTTDINVELSLGQEHNESEDATTLAVLTALFTVSDLDVYVSPQQYFDMFMKDGGFADISLFVDQEVLDRYAGDLYYYEAENGTRSVAGIILHEGSPLHKAGYYHSDVIIGICARAANLEEGVAFVKQLLTAGK